MYVVLYIIANLYISYSYTISRVFFFKEESNWHCRISSIGNGKSLFSASYINMNIKRKNKLIDIKHVGKYNFLVFFNLYIRIYIGTIYSAYLYFVYIHRRVDRGWLGFSFLIFGKRPAKMLIYCYTYMIFRDRHT